jgi:TIR domain
MPNLFLGHAWEDKEAFVRPLAEALRGEFEVWYDEYSLRPGDSLLEGISQGLHNCDRAVVVLSPNFFAKQWTQAELNGFDNGQCGNEIRAIRFVAG